MKNQDHQNQNLKPTNINKGLKDCGELNSDNLPNDVDEIFTEINLRKVKYFFFFFSTYHCHSQSEDYSFTQVRNFLDAFSSTYD